MDAPAVYDWLIGGGGRPACEAFDAHVVASVLALAIAEAGHSGTSVTAAIGLAGEPLLAFIAATFPAALPQFERLDHAAVELTADESCLRDLLCRFATDNSPFEQALAALIARRAQHPNHLWQDLGLRHRRELGWLMERHFERLASRNSQDMKWKKFLYRMICRDEGYSLCTAPVCQECDDFDACFGAEGGESLLARNRRTAA